MNPNIDKPPPLGRILETSLYVNDVAQARAFYEDVLGLHPMLQDERLIAYAVGPGSVLLLFRKGTTDRPAPTPGGTIPQHHGAGHLHYAFSVSAEDVDRWRAYLVGKGVAIESEVTWPRGSRSLYFRDPESNLVEIATPGLWDNY